MDRNGQPLPLKHDSFDYLDKAVKFDSEFLSSLKVVDYSLLLLIDEEKQYIRTGIIEYLRIYDWEKKIEHHGKKIIKGVDPTIITPEGYKDRFVKAMRKYFMYIPQDC
jgi:hypothetical protein